MNDLNRKISALSVTATSAVIFLGVIYLSPLLSSAGSGQKLAAAIVTALTSFGLYKAVALGIQFAFNYVQWFRKKILGEYFIEGTWVGHWVHEGKNVFTVEAIYQELGNIRVIGRQFGEDGKTQADWASEFAIIDQQRERLIYMYTCDVFRTKHQQNGIGVFKLERPKRKAAPNVLDGYAVDMVDADKDTNREHKISDGEVSTELALQKAREIFGV